MAELAATGAFEDMECEVTAWTLTLDARQTRALYATFSPITRLAERERERLLDGIERVAEGEFGGKVERNMLTPAYIARRR